VSATFHAVSVSEILPDEGVCATRQTGRNYLSWNQAEVLCVAGPQSGLHIDFVLVALL
jgi:hypothetical protein